MAASSLLQFGHYTTGFKGRLKDLAGLTEAADKRYCNAWGHPLPPPLLPAAASPVTWLVLLNCQTKLSADIYLYTVVPDQQIQKGFLKLLNSFLNLYSIYLLLHTKELKLNGCSQFRLSDGFTLLCLKRRHQKSSKVNNFYFLFPSLRPWIHLSA